MLLFDLLGKHQFEMMPHDRQYPSAFGSWQIAYSIATETLVPVVMRALAMTYYTSGFKFR